MTDKYPELVDVLDLLNEPEPAYDWVIPGLLERMDRLIVTGEEGKGKSTLLRQWTVQSGSGIHPFTLEDMDPLKVLLLDLENSRTQIRRKARGLVETAGLRLPPGQANMLIRPAGVDLAHSGDQYWLESHLDTVQPQLLIAGPLYKMASSDPSDEVFAKRVAVYLDSLRSKYQLTLILEAHSPYAQAGGPRPKRPFGWSGWSRWPEFGVHLAEDGKLSHWRGPRDERDWPKSLQWGDRWPWMIGDEDPHSKILAEAIDIARSQGYKPSLRDLERKMSTASKSTIARVLQDNKEAWDTCLDSLP